MNPTPHLSEPGHSPLPNAQDSQSLWRVSAFSQMGMGRTVNQDSVSFRSPDAFVVADGVGGGAWGETASEMLATGLSTLYQPNEQAVNEAMAKLDQDIASTLSTRGDGAGAAVVAGLWRTDALGQDCLASWVGDCQLSHWRLEKGQWEMVWQSKEQSYALCGIAPPPGVGEHSPANMVGCGMGLPVSHQRLRFTDRQRIVISSDGCWRALSPAQLHAFMNRLSGQLPVDAAQQLCALALDAGSEDDISVLIIEKHSHPNKPFLHRLTTQLGDAVFFALVMLGLAVLFWAWQGGAT